MRSKLKLKILFAVCTIVVTIIASLCVAVGFLASNILGDNSYGYMTNYNCKNVCAAVSATGQVDGKDSFDFVSTQHSTLIILDQNKAAASFAAVGDICLSYENRAVTFEYTFENRDEEAFCVFATLPETIKNVSIEETNTQGANIQNHQLIVEGGKTEIYRIRVAIKSLAHNAQFGGSLNFVLTNIF